MRPRRTRIIVAVGISLTLHTLLVVGWFAGHPGDSLLSSLESTEVDAPTDSEFSIVLRDPPRPQIAPPQVETPPPRVLPSEVLKPAIESVGAGAVKTIGDSPPSPPSLPRASRPLHGKLKAGKTIVYAIDRSSSMGTDGLLDSACRAIKDSLEQLDPDARFQIVAYNSGAITISATPLLASSANKTRANRWLDGLSAEGSSNHVSGLRESLAHQPDALFLLTDADDFDGKEVRTIRPLFRERVYLNVAIFGTRSSSHESVLERLLAELNGSVRYLGR